MCDKKDFVLSVTHQYLVKEKIDVLEIKNVSRQQESILIKFETPTDTAVYPLKVGTFKDVINEQDQLYKVLPTYLKDTGEITYSLAVSSEALAPLNVIKPRYSYTRIGESREEFCYTTALYKINDLDRLSIYEKKLFQVGKLSDKAREHLKLFTRRDWIFNNAIDWAVLRTLWELWMYKRYPMQVETDVLNTVSNLVIAFGFDDTDAQLFKSFMRSYYGETYTKNEINTLYENFRSRSKSP